MDRPAVAVAAAVTLTAVILSECLPADRVVACRLATQLAAADPWPLPDGMGMEEAVRASGDERLIAELDRALDTVTVHEAVVGPGHRAVAPSEARWLVAVCEGT